MFRLIFNLILISAALGLFLVYIKPNYNGATDTSIVSMKQQQASISQTLASLVDLQKKQDELSAKRNEFSSRSDGAEQKLDRMIPEQINPVIFIMELNTIASDYNMVVKNVKFESKKVENDKTKPVVYEAKKPYHQFDLSFSVDGSYANFVNFIRSLESNLRLTDVVSVTVSANDKVDLYQYNVRLVTYSAE